MPGGNDGAGEVKAHYVTAEHDHSAVFANCTLHLHRNTKVVKTVHQANIVEQSRRDVGVSTGCYQQLIVVQGLTVGERQGLGLRIKLNDPGLSAQRNVL